jgi:hypothetical protein
VPRHQRLEGLLGLARGEFPHQRHVVIHHPLNKWTPAAKGDKLFRLFDDEHFDGQVGGDQFEA